VGVSRKTMNMKVSSRTAEPHPAIIAEASVWFIEFRAGDVNGDARVRFIEWLRRSPEHIQAYLEIAGVWAELPHSAMKRKSTLQH
jgi:ferric-dicitrate binding protein FerR (iron transport regulator)